MKIITLSREYAAGGHSVGRKVAETLGVELYDKDIIKEAALSSGLDTETVIKAEESMTRLDNFIRSINPVTYEQKDIIFSAEKDAILNFAKLGPCVILGRCADAILRDAGYETLNVFLYSDYAHRSARAADMLHSSDPAYIRKTIKSIDANRHAYFNYYTDKEWGSPSNYDLMLNTGTLGYDLCVKLICEAAKK